METTRPKMHYLNQVVLLKVHISNGIALSHDWQVSKISFSLQQTIDDQKFGTF